MNTARRNITDRAAMFAGIGLWNWE